MESIEHSETVDAEGGRAVLLEFSRKWPKYVVSWSVRERVGDSDFPGESGTVESLPSAERQDEEIWQELRDEALNAARQTARPPQAGVTSAPKRGLIDRLLGRN